MSLIINPSLYAAGGGGLPILDNVFTQSPLDGTSEPWYVVELSTYLDSAVMSSGLTIIGGGSDHDNTYSYVTRDDVPSLLTGTNFRVSTDCLINNSVGASPRGLAVRASNSPASDFAGFFRTVSDAGKEWGVVWRQGGSLGFQFLSIVADNLGLGCDGTTMRWYFDGVQGWTRTMTLSGCQPALVASHFPAGSGSSTAFYDNFSADVF